MRVPGRFRAVPATLCGTYISNHAARSTVSPCLSAFFAGEELHYEQNERHDDQQVDEEAGDVIDEEADDPDDHQQNGESKDGSGSHEHLNGVRKLARGNGARAQLYH